MLLYYYTLGCKVNQYETQALERLSIERGHTLAREGEHADAFIINSCTVTAVSDKKTRQLVRRLRRDNPDAVIAVCGCYAQTSAEELEAIRSVDIICGTTNRADVIGMVETVFSERAHINAVSSIAASLPFEVLPAGGLEGRTRALLKVQDGCTNFCAYCIIPYARGGVRSMPIETAVAEAERLAREGYREIVLTGIEISSFGRDLDGAPRLVDLVDALCAAVPQVRFRLGSLEPRTVDEAFCTRLQKYKNLCPQFHLSLQSGCDATLRRMRRRYDTARYAQSLALLRAAFPGCAVTTDLITGFPGETEEEFSDTLAFIRQCAFSAMHIFPYSRRKGTPAYSMKEQVPAAEKHARAARAAAAAREMTDAYLASQVGRVLTVLFEQKENGLEAGHSENYCLVHVRTNDSLKGRMLPVRITGWADGVLSGALDLPGEAPQQI